MMKVIDLVKDINELCDYESLKHNYFFGYGLIKETIKLWKDKNNYKLLNKTASYMVDQIISL